MKFFIVGYGSIGRRHLRNLLALGEKDIWLYRTRQSTLPEEEIADIPVETNLQAVFDHRPDAVVIANPTALHLDVAIPAAEAGCHILMEKPISNSLERISELQAALKRGGGKLLMGFQFRFHPGLQKVSALLNEGRIGRLLSLRTQWGEYLPNWHPWEDYRKSYSARGDLGGGVVLTLCHPLDYLNWLVGKVESLWAFTGKISDLEIQVDDVGEIGLQFDNGVLGSLHLDYYRSPPIHQFEMVGTEGVLAWDNANGVTRLTTSSGESCAFELPPGFERNQMFLDEMRHFIQVVRGEAQPICSLEDGSYVLQLALAINKSANEKRIVHPIETASQR